MTGVVGTATLAITGTIKATHMATKHYDLKIAEDRKELTTIVAKCYWPMILCGAITVTSVLMAKSVADKQAAALTAAYKMAADTVDKLKDYIDNNAEPPVQEIDKDRIETMYKQATVPEGEGDLFFDGQTGQLFRSTKETIRAAQNHCNARYIGEVTNGVVHAAEVVDINEFITEIGEHEVDFGDVELGWEPGIWTKPTPMLSVKIDTWEVDGQLVYLLIYNVYNITREYF